MTLVKTSIESKWSNFGSLYMDHSKSYNALARANLIGSTKSHTNTFYFCAILISACTHLNKELIQGYPKMDLTSQKVAKFFKTTSFFTLSTYIFIITNQYFAYIHFPRESMENNLYLKYWINLWHYGILGFFLNCEQKN